MGTSGRGLRRLLRHCPPRRCRRDKRRCSRLQTPTFGMLCSASAHTGRRIHDVVANIGRTRKPRTNARPRQASPCQADIRSKLLCPLPPQTFLGGTLSKWSYREVHKSRLDTTRTSSSPFQMQKNLQGNPNKLANSSSPKSSPWHSWNTAGARNPRAH